MSVLNENTIIGASGAGGDYEIEQSLRFDDGRETRLIRTPSTASNRKTFTWSGWVKRTNIDTTNVVFSSYVDSSNFFGIRLRENGDNGALEVFNFSSGNDLNLTTTQKFRDPSAWYHIVVAIDTTQGTNTNRVKIYINGSQVTDFGVATYPSQNFDTDVNNTNAHYVGSLGAGNYHDGYLAEVNFIDGQALTPDSFGETGTYGEWKPIAYDGTYGTNGFYLPFEQDYTVEGFSTVTYEGTRQNQYIGGTGFKPDLVWMKTRSATGNSVIIDSVRGGSKALQTSTTSSENQYGTADDKITAFNNDGFTLGVDAAGYGLNNDGVDTVAWNWDMGGTTASNTNGSITSSVRANTTYGQSIVSWTGNATNASTIGHGLSSTPTMIIVKSRTTAAPWKVGGSVIQAVYGDGSNNSAFLSLNTTAAADQHTTGFQGNTATTIGVGADSDTNSNGANYIAYCFHDVANYSKFGSYSGNGSNTGTVVTTGFNPAFVMIKRSSSTGGWIMLDNTRSAGPNPINHKLQADDAGAEDVDTAWNISFLSNGFQLGSNHVWMNASGSTYIYMAFADTREYAYWYDQSGNNNDWTSEGGLTESDVMVDSPTNNFCTLNPLDHATGNAGTLSEGNLKFTNDGNDVVRGTLGATSGKWYAEYRYGTSALNSAPMMIGLMGLNGPTAHSGMDRAVYMYSDNGGNTNLYVVENGSGTNTNVSGLTGITPDTVLQLAWDVDSGRVWVGKDNTWLNSGNPSGNATPTITMGTSGNNAITIGFDHAGGAYNAMVNCGQDSSFAGNKTPQGNQDSNGIGDFYYQPPSGFLSLCSANLPSVDVIPSEHFNTVLYTGTGANQSITGVGFEPSLVWMKNRSASQSHALVDVVRGRSKILFSDGTNAEQTSATVNDDLVSFDTDGFTVGPPERAGSTNNNGSSIVAWNWKAGGTAVSNTNGSITSSVSANPSAGFSIVSYTALDSDETVGHGLSQTPELVLVKRRDSTGNWVSHFTNLATTNKQLYLNLTNALDSNNISSVGASTFRVNGWADVATASATYIAYAFHSVDGYSKVGSYTGNGSTDGTFVHCGFKPAWVMVKRTDASGDDWHMMDNTRSPFNLITNRLKANSSDAEATNDTMIDSVSNGFKLRNASGARNASGGTYIFLAFAENPFKHTNAR